MFPLYFLYDLWAVLALRIALGAILVAHGWPKLRDPRHIFEFVTGILLILGLGVTWVAALVALELIVLLLWSWKKRAAFVGGWELQLLMLAGAITLFSLGGGVWSLDRILFGIL